MAARRGWRRIVGLKQLVITPTYLYSSYKRRRASRWLFRTVGFASQWPGRQRHHPPPPRSNRPYIQLKSRPAGREEVGGGGIKCHYKGVTAQLCSEVPAGCWK